MASDSETNPFLQGNFAPWRSEDDYPQLRVVGELPRELNGTYYRNGPNPAFEPKGRYHWFDGDGMIHAVTIRDGKASYRNRYVMSSGLEQEMEAGKALYSGLLEFGPEMLSEGPQFKNTGNTNIVAHAGKLLALMEGSLPTQMQPGTLETLGVYDFNGKLGTAMTAHPKLDPETGEMLFFGYAPVPPFLTYHVADKNGVLVRSEVIDIEWPSMIHDFVTTREHVIFILCPLVFSLENLANTGSLFSWEAERGTRLGVMPRGGGNGDVRWFSTDACYVFHPLNAYGSGNRLIVEAARFGRLTLMEPREHQDGGPDTVPRLHRWTIDLASGSLQSEPLDDRVAEFPRVDDRRVGLQHRYGYMAGAGAVMDGAPSFNAIYKFDLQTGRSWSHEFGADNGCGEAIFVPKNERAGEDEGFLMTFFYDAARDTSELVLLDAQNISDEPIARIQIPHRVPYGFHGNWVAAT